MSVASSLKRKRIRNRWLLMTATIFGLLLGVGAITGAAILGRLSGAIHTGVLAFGSAALIYLVTEELLVEAHDHDTPENPFTAAIFFAGFLLVICIEMSY